MDSSIGCDWLDPALAADRSLVSSASAEGEASGRGVVLVSVKRVQIIPFAFGRELQLFGDLSDVRPCQNMAQGCFMVKAVHESRHERQVKKFLTPSTFPFWDISDTKQ